MMKRWSEGQPAYGVAAGAAVASLGAALTILLAPGLDGYRYPLALVAETAVFLVAVAWLVIRVRRSERRLVEAQSKLSTVTVHDAAAVKFNEAQLPDKTTILEAALNHMSQGFALILPDGKIWAYNRKAVEFSGVTEDKFTFPATAREIFQAQMESGELGKDGELLPPEMRQFLLKGVGTPPASYIRRRPNGTVIEVRSGPVPGGGTVQSFSDVTELMRAKDAAEAATRAKSAFLATMSHEIRTPLNGILGLAELLAKSQLSDAQAANVKTLIECGDALLCVINDVLDFSKLESGSVQLEQAPVDLRDLCAAALDITAPMATPKNLALSWTVDEDVPKYVLGDAARLRQVLLNLVGNAIKFTEAGSVTVHLSKTDNERIRGEVVDTGIGIPVEARGRIFKDFSQVDSSISRRFGGTGLGLAICKRLIETMGGAIGVESEQGVGSRFWFEVPLEIADAPRAAAAGDVGIATGPRLRVLLADDGRVNRMVGMQMLALLGHTVDLAEDGVEAVEKVQAGRYDLVLMDMQMPRMDGLAAAKAIRALPGPRGQVPIVALTANQAASDRAACAEAGMDEFLSKPFRAAQLGGVISRIIRHVADGRSAPTGEPSVDEGRLARLVGHLGKEEVEDLLICVDAEVKHLIEQLRAAALRRDAEKFAATSQSLWTSLSAVGFSGLAARYTRRGVPFVEANEAFEEGRATLQASLTSARTIMHAIPSSQVLH